MLKEEFNEKYKDFFEKGCPGIEVKLHEETLEMLNCVFDDLTKIPNFKLIEFKVNEETLKTEFITSLNSFTNEVVELAIYDYEKFYRNKELEEA